MIVTPIISTFQLELNSEHLLIVFHMQDTVLRVIQDIQIHNLWFLYCCCLILCLCLVWTVGFFVYLKHMYPVPPLFHKCEGRFND